MPPVMEDGVRTDTFALTPTQVAMVEGEPNYGRTVFFSVGGAGDGTPLEFRDPDTNDLLEGYQLVIPQFTASVLADSGLDNTDPGDATVQIVAHGYTGGEILFFSDTGDGPEYCVVQSVVDVNNVVLSRGAFDSSVVAHASTTGFLVAAALAADHVAILSDPNTGMSCDIVASGVGDVTSLDFGTKIAGQDGVFFYQPPGSTAPAYRVSPTADFTAKFTSEQFAAPQVEASGRIFNAIFIFNQDSDEGPAWGQYPVLLSLPRYAGHVLSVIGYNLDRSSSTLCKFGAGPLHNTIVAFLANGSITQLVVAFTMPVTG